MKTKRDRPIPILSFVYRALLICLIALGLMFVGGTIYGIFFHAPPQSYQRPTLQTSRREGQTFTDIGRIRVPTADPQPGTAILSVSFIYYPEDKAFSEELILRVKDFRDIITSYISSFSASELQSQGENTIKTELLRRFNAILRLGQIETLYFSDFLII
jgi:flagellar basal body-associated protein FliL